METILGKPYKMLVLPKFLSSDGFTITSLCFLFLIAVHVSRLISQRMIFKEGLAGSFPIVLLLFQVYEQIGIEEDLGWLRTVT